MKYSHHITHIYFNQIWYTNTSSHFSLTLPFSPSVSLIHQSQTFSFNLLLFNFSMFSPCSNKCWMLRSYEVLWMALHVNWVSSAKLANWKVKQHGVLKIKFRSKIASHVCVVFKMKIPSNNQSVHIFGLNAYTIKITIIESLDEKWTKNNFI